MNFMNSKMKLDQKFSGAGGLGEAYAKAFVQAGLVVLDQNCHPTTEIEAEPMSQLAISVKML